MDNNQPTSHDYLKPWSIVPDDELARLRSLEMIARHYVLKLLQDQQTLGLTVAGSDKNYGFSLDDLRRLVIK